MQEERRQFKRVSLVLEVRCADLGNYALRTSDISHGGCYIETIGGVTPGQQIRFEVHLPTGQWVPLQGEVVYHHPTLGFGVRFIDLPQSVKDLLTLVIPSR